MAFIEYSVIIEHVFFRSAVGSEGLLEVIISKQIQQDIKKLTTPLQPAKVATLLKDEVVKDELLESDTDDRGGARKTRNISSCVRCA